MQLKTILNRVEYFQSFVYGKAHWVENGSRPTIEVCHLVLPTGSGTVNVRRVHVVPVVMVTRTTPSSVTVSVFRLPRWKIFSMPAFSGSTSAWNS